MLIRLLPLLRLSTIHAERARLAILARRFGLHPDDGTADTIGPGPMKFLTVRTNESNRALIEDVLDGNGSLTEGVDLHAAEGMRAGGAFGACVLAIGSEDDPYNCLEFCDPIRNNPRLFNLPVLLLDSTCPSRTRLSPSDTGPPGSWSDRCTARKFSTT